MSQLVIWLAAFIASVPVLSAPTADDDLLITLPNGQIRGALYYTTNASITYYGWRGIPYGAPPVGDLRFEAPQPAEPWTGILNATEDGPSCIDLLDISSDQSEDCLFINVYVPADKPTEKLPVMFWIYGAGFSGGAGDKPNYGPDYFMLEGGVIIVTHNYRSGPLGFLSTGDSAISGNAGLKDQVLAMQWTKDNIEYFGGDPEKVTIFGESSGGQCVGLHLVSNRTAGLFRAAIVQSGSGLTNSSVTLTPADYAFRFASYISGGDYGNDTSKLAAFLRNRTADELTAAANQITGVDDKPLPVIEEESDDAFLTDYPYVLYDTGNSHRVPAMMGICAEEGFNGENEIRQGAALLDADPIQLIPLDIRPKSEDVEATLKKIRGIYLQEEATFLSNLTAAVKFQSDQKFAKALIKNAELHSKYAPVYLYQFAYSTYTTTIAGIDTAGHGAEMGSLFYFSLASPHLSDDDDDDDNDDDDDDDEEIMDDLVQRRTTKLWVNFAKYLDPTPEEIELFENVTWPTMSPDNIQYININETLEIRQDLKGEDYRTWNETYYEYGTKPFSTF